VELIIDIGNTRAKLAWFHEARLLRLAHAPHATEEELLARAAEAPVEAIGIGSVGADASLLANRLRALAPVLPISGETPAPIRNAYATQATLGADRWANAVAAAGLFPGRAVLAIDAGSCITYDVVEPDGRYAGGAIAPGLAMRARAMHAYSARLPLVNPQGASPAPFARSTSEALLSGVVHGTLHECQGYIADFQRAFPGGAVVLAGGDGLPLLRGLKSGIFAHPYLTLEGYRRILHHHRAGLGR
jgi:type III pantothenate kinase